MQNQSFNSSSDKIELTSMSEEEIIRFIRKAIKKLRKYSNKKILVYPNSGENFNSKFKTWFGEKKINNKEFSSWIDESPDIVGGCCRIGKNEIKKMKSFIENGVKKSI